MSGSFGGTAKGNAVETRLFGDKTSPVFIATFTAFDARGRKLAEYGAPVVTPGQAGLVRPVRRYAYSVFDKTTQDTDALGNTRRFEFNALGTQVKEIDPQGKTTITRIDLFGRETAMVSQLGNTTLKFYDLQGRLVKERDPLGNETGHTYDAFDRQLTQTNALGEAMHYAYDQRDRLVSAQAPQGFALTTSDAFWALEERQRLGFTVTETDADGNTTVRAKLAAELSAADRSALIAHYAVSYAYDGRDNRTSTFYPLAQLTAHSH